MPTDQREQAEEQRHTNGGEQPAVKEKKRSRMPSLLRKRAGSAMLRPPMGKRKSTSMKLGHSVREFLMIKRKSVYMPRLQLKIHSATRISMNKLEGTMLGHRICLMLR